MKFQFSQRRGDQIAMEQYSCDVTSEFGPWSEGAEDRRLGVASAIAKATQSPTTKRNLPVPPHPSPSDTQLSLGHLVVQILL